MRIAGAVLLLVVLTGCTAAPVTQDAEAEPTVSPTADYVVPDAPAQVFGGDCALLQLGGEWATADEEPIVDPARMLVQQHGGVRCSWTAPRRSLVVVLLPESAVDIPSELDCGELFDAAAASCEVDAVVNGIRISGHVLGDDLAQLQADRDTVLAQFAIDAAGASGVLDPLPLPGAWVAPMDCVSLAASADLAAATALDAEFVGESLEIGTDAYRAPAERALWAQSPTCGVYGLDGDDEVGLMFQTLGGGRWVETVLRADPSAEVLEIDGLELVITATAAPGATSLNVFDGANWLQTWVPQDERVYPAIAALVAALNS